MDGAHAFAHFPFTRDALGCDYYGASLHKWLGVPLGAGIRFIGADVGGGFGVRGIQGKIEAARDAVTEFEEITKELTAPAIEAETSAVRGALALSEGLQRSP